MGDFQVTMMSDWITEATTTAGRNFHNLHLGKDSWCTWRGNVRGRQEEIFGRRLSEEYVKRLFNYWNAGLRVYVHWISNLQQLRFCEADCRDNPNIQLMLIGDEGFGSYRNFNPYGRRRTRKFELSCKTRDWWWSERRYRWIPFPVVYREKASNWS